MSDTLFETPFASLNPPDLVVQTDGYPTVIINPVTGASTVLNPLAPRLSPDISYEVSTIAAFGKLVNDYKLPGTRVFGKAGGNHDQGYVSGLVLTAMLDAPTVERTPALRREDIRLVLAKNPQLVEFLAKPPTDLNQDQFAKALQKLRNQIVDPTREVLSELVSDLRVLITDDNKAAFGNGGRQDKASRTITVTAGNNEATVPSMVNLQFTPYIGGELNVILECPLNVDITREGKPLFSLIAPAPAEFWSGADQAQVDKVSAMIGLPVYL